ncbi:conserved hypothetical protein [Xanthomonas albilineans GPE PC73]|uniref:KfrA N-terminal DNA-binding domain-containing protein n=2 Tax=Xanthomonas albilineans TaxID=29447 RepID=D2UDP4_XANAP|nr:DNA-binding protein [Xanthomonas albilineans]CBA16036.1 conserved hypothetical protein [Xanthomonas albilineans GPE PC73]
MIVITYREYANHRAGRRHRRHSRRCRRTCAAGERPTVERIRAHLGTGSPNTVVRWLDTWWQGLGDRIANVPEAVSALVGQWWTLALDHARSHAGEAIAAERTALQDARSSLEGDRHGCRPSSLSYGVRPKLPTKRNSSRRPELLSWSAWSSNSNARLMRWSGSVTRR